MKKLILLVFGVLLAANNLKAIEVAEAIEKAFKQQFPNAKKVKWEKENNDYEASFMMDKKEMSAVYSQDAKWIETETEISVSELPKAVVESVSKLYPGTKINEAARIQRADNSIVYEAEIKVNKKEKDVLFDENGKEVK